MAKAARPYGSGTLILRGKIWWCSYMLNGERQRESTGETDWGKAKNFLEGKIGQRVRGELRPKAYGITMADVLDWYLHKKERLSPDTLSTYRGNVNNHLKPFFGEMLATGVTYDVLEKYREKRSKEYVADPVRRGKRRAKVRKRKLVQQSTINREVTLVGSALRLYAKKHPHIAVPQLPKESEKNNVRHGFMRERDLEAFLAELPIHLRCFAACAFYCGGRTSEWLRLDWEDVDFETGLIYFRKTKTKHPREVPIWEDTHMERQLRAQRERAEKDWPHQEAVFTEDGSKRIKTVARAFNSAAARIGRPNLRPHDMRRSANRWMRDNRVEQLTRIYIMGHRTQSMDIRYGNVDLEAINAARSAVKEKQKESR